MILVFSVFQTMGHGCHCVCVEVIMRTVDEYDDSRLNHVKCYLGHVQRKNLSSSDLLVNVY